MKVPTRKKKDASVAHTRPAQGNAPDLEVQKRARQQFQGLLEAAPDAMLMVNPAGKITLINAQAEKLFGYDRNELVGESLEALVPKRFRSRHAEQCAGFFAHVDVRPMGTGLVLTGLRKQGDEFPTEIMLSPVATTEGTLVLAAIRDVTERIRAEEAVQRMNDALEEQAKRIAHSIHDESGQLLASAHIALEEAAGGLPAKARNRLQKVKRLLDKAEEQLRQFSHELRPTILDDLGLVPALVFLAKSVSRRARLHITTECTQDVRFAPPVETALYRIAQAALTNVARHAKASTVNIRIQTADGKVRCSIKDDGVGFDLLSVLDRRGQRGLGLIGIQARLDALGGTFVVHTSPGHGAELVVTLPLEKQNAAPNHSGR